MYKDLKINNNLYFLQQLLFTLDFYSFDSDITSAINDLKTIVDNKIYANFNFENKDIINQDIFARFYLKD